MFTRTSSGLVEKWRFYGMPTVWVEGPTDIIFFAAISRKIYCRFEAYGGRENAVALIAGLKTHDYPYVVVRDGDYEILNRRRAPHGRVLVLPRYSMENLLWEAPGVDEACRRYSRCGEGKDLVSVGMRDTETMIARDLLAAVILDVAARRMPSSPRVLPARIDAVLRGKWGTQVDPVRVEGIVGSVKERIDEGAQRGARRDVERFVEQRPLVHLLKGHLVLGLLRRVFLDAARKEGRKGRGIEDDVLVQVVSDGVWATCRGGDHLRVRTEFRRKIRLAGKRMGQMKEARGV